MFLSCVTAMSQAGKFFEHRRPGKVLGNGQALYGAHGNFFLMKIVACGFSLYLSHASYPFRSYKRAAAAIWSVVSK
jgi:hypothetical protein